MFDTEFCKNFLNSYIGDLWDKTINKKEALKVKLFPYVGQFFFINKYPTDVKSDGFRSQLEASRCIATLKSYITKPSVCGLQYIYIYKLLIVG